MGPIQYFREWLSQFDADTETLESMRDAIQAPAIRRVIDAEIMKIELRNENVPF